MLSHTDAIGLISRGLRAHLEGEQYLIERLHIALEHLSKTLFSLLEVPVA
ncbi:hypothetical protein HMPREF1487_08371 [Pseudomonas sp. HPB0071]|uniref:Uncharacterized protein n=1 Tax=Pseudomonas luteola TaxID=47886 RepID=A0A2X2E0Y4_PSELU|nr:hypothetical protein HMPREF1487_08371 [Pseudomonas sp. HPB0071]SHJ61654.1 hypothetical protein SAMN05216295_1199 [Pseudomonas zeshuii]SPZ01729.1 Uncharacterised protein [Pseudomonas luteola]